MYVVIVGSAFNDMGTDGLHLYGPYESLNDAKAAVNRLTQGDAEIVKLEEEE